MRSANWHQADYFRTATIPSAIGALPTSHDFIGGHGLSHLRPRLDAIASTLVSSRSSSLALKLACLTQVDDLDVVGQRRGAGLGRPVGGVAHLAGGFDLVQAGEIHARVD